ncbi:hypothetical protein H6P81_008947 [Aristolochia fimbriata]|uniref:NHL repeat-containing protein n=1 Tax=Aristolochia fimbriata TaxID=158543 RepID=A0AAV7EMN4_ARIFI|nr:hypothetical protein H6P81_008947 [Aristolochia fimbriata]
MGRITKRRDLSQVNGLGSLHLFLESVGCLALDGFLRFFRQYDDNHAIDWNTARRTAGRMSSACTSIFLLSLLLLLVSASARNNHVINFRSFDLFPESAAWDPSAQHFVVGSVRRPSLHSVSDAGLVDALISDPDLPANVSILGVAVDSPRRRVLAVITTGRRSPPFDALAAYDLRSPRVHRIFLSPLAVNSTTVPHRPIVNGIALDHAGNAFVTASLGNFIWKVDVEGTASVFSESPIFQFQPNEVSPNESYSWCGLNGIAYASSGYLLVVQTNTGKIFKVDGVDGRARLVGVGKSLWGAEGIAIRGDGSAVVVSQREAWLLKSNDAWAEAAVYDQVGLDEERFPTGVVVRERNEAYVLYGRANEGMMGRAGVEEFTLEELEWEREKQGEYVWAFVFVGFGLCYFTYWRFQMGQLVRNMNKKTA